jgi:VWFA-related protein
MGAGEFGVKRAGGLAVRLLGALGWLLALAGVAAAGEIAEFRLSQAVVKPPRVMAYLEVLDARGNPMPVAPDQLTAALGSEGLTLESLEPFKSRNAGVAYILLVDISKSLTRREFGAMRQVLLNWVDMMTPQDQAMLVTFGTQVKQVVDFTGDKAMLKAALDQLHPTDNYTQLHLGLIKALEAGRRADPGLPLRRAILVLSDGREDYAGGVTRQEVMAQLAVDPVPIYAIGFYTPPQQAVKEEALKKLGEFARTSGGTYFRAEGGDFSQIYEKIRQRIENVYLAQLRCEQCLWNGAVRHLQLELIAGTKALRSGLDIRLAAFKPYEAPKADSAPDLPPRSWWPLPSLVISKWTIPWWLYSGVILTLLLLSLMVFLLIHSSRPKAMGESRPFDQSQAHTTKEIPMHDKTYSGPDPSTTVALGTAAAKPKSASPGIKGRLIFIRGEAGKSPLEFTLTNSLTLGRAKPPCDLAFPEDQEISREHCRFLLEDGGVKIMDLGSKNGTLVNGVPVTGKYPLKQDDIIRIGRTELRLLLT